MNDERPDVKFVTHDKRYCENCREKTSHDIGATGDGTPVKQCIRCGLISYAGR
ncbi:MAG: hypothetical protein KGL39_33940 [Patescibacteria group bacterium]|nr:hypothetical protein [Patescibacteria group bacterium]